MQALHSPSSILISLLLCYDGYVMLKFAAVRCHALKPLLVCEQGPRLVEEADCVGTAAHAGQQQIRLAAKGRLALSAHLLADYCLEVSHLPAPLTLLCSRVHQFTPIRQPSSSPSALSATQHRHAQQNEQHYSAHHHGVGVRPGSRAQDVVRGFHVGDPVANSLACGILQRRCARRHRPHLQRTTSDEPLKYRKGLQLWLSPDGAESGTGKQQFACNFNNTM